jgi:transcriptional regulator with XRE-family HTH domain
MVESDRDSSSCSLGSALSSERKRKNIPLSEISRQTNISIKTLEALENGQFQKLPGGFYLKNYIRSYLAAIGSEEAAFFESFRETLHSAQAGSREKKRTHYAKLRYARFKKKSAFLSGFIFFLVFAIVFFMLYLGKQHVLSSSLQLPPTVVPPPPFSSSPPCCIDFWPVQVEIEFLDNCWMQVYRGQQQNQQKVSEQVYQPGDHLKIKGYALYFFIGNPAALRFYLNGTELTYLKNQARSERLTINPQKLDEILRK